MSVQSHVMFNSLLKDFMSQLRKAFPNNESIKTAKKKVKTATSVTPELVCRLFHDFVKEHADLLKKRDNQFIHGEAGESLKKTLGIDVKELWSVCDDNTKEKIWEFLNALYDTSCMADSPVNIPSGAMVGIQELAKNLEGSFNADNGDIKSTLQSIASTIDPASIKNIVSMIDPNLAKEMQQGIESGELMNGVQEMISNIDPKMIESITSGFDGANGDMSSMINSVMSNMDPAMITKAMSIMNKQ